MQRTAVSTPSICALSARVQAASARKTWQYFAAALGCALMFVMTLTSTAATAADIVIDDARTRIENDILLLDASATFEFSSDALEALTSGIPLFIELDLTVTRERKFLWDRELFSAHRRYSIEYHALTKKFLVGDAITGERRAFAELAPAMAELGRIRDLAVAEAGDIDLADSYDCALRLRLDLESLPAPMIPLAYISPGWHMSSGWYRWQIAR